MRGNAGDALLDSYEIERKPHVRAVVASAKEFGKIIGELDPAAAVARDARLRAELKSGKAETIRQKFIPDLVGGLIASGAKLAGGLFVQPQVRTAGGRVKRLDDLLEPEFVIATATHAAMSGMSDAALAGWRQIGGERVVIAASGAGSNQDGVITVVEHGRLFADWMRANAVEAVIVRPDRYVFAGAENADQLNMLIQQLIQNLHAGP
jgi:3-(3-hydroxy-phenyl)propionate hydroxylase